MNALTDLLNKKQEKLFSIFFTAGYPRLESTGKVLLSLQENGVDFAEIGMPYSDPLADGPVIQQTNTIAIANGMGMQTLFTQLMALRGSMTMPLVLMGYLNPVLQYGVEPFCRRAAEAGVSGVILPDLPLHEYRENYREMFLRYQLHAIFLITPTSKPERIREVDKLSTAFIYAVSASSTTGTPGEGEQQAIVEQKIRYLSTIRDMKLNSPVVVGFGIKDQASLNDAWQYTSGAIIGTEYLRQISAATHESQAIGMLEKKLGLNPE